MSNVTLPNYEEMARVLYDLCVNQDIGSIIGPAEIVAALRHAERVGFTLGREADDK